MTQLTRDTNGKIIQIPPDVDTVEKLKVWCSEVLAYNYPNVTSVEALDTDGNPIKMRCIESNAYYFTAPSSPVWRHSSRSSIELAPEFKVYGKPWNHAKSLGDSPVPPQMQLAYAA